MFFDVFGTLVDRRTSIAREARAILAPMGVAIDWEAFADAWRAQYQPAMEEVRAGCLPFSKLDTLHRRNLDVVLKDSGLDRIDEPTRDCAPPSSPVRTSMGQAGAKAAPACRWMSPSRP